MSELMRPPPESGGRYRQHWPDYLYTEWGRRDLNTPRIDITPCYPRSGEGCSRMPQREIHPRKARTDYFRARRDSLKESSLRSYKFPTKHFIEFVETQGIQSMGEVDGYVLEQWKLDRKEDNIKPITLHNNVKHVRRFIRWCESSELVQDDLADKIEVPEVSKSQETSGDKITPATANEVLRYFERYEYATRDHALFALLWHTGCRISAAISLDVGDYDPKQGYVSFKNREETGTPVKNGNESERNVTLSDEIQSVLTDYIEGRRHAATDDHGREPIFTTREGNRARRQLVYKNITAYTRPCIYTNRCPHNRDIETCDAAQHKRDAPSCPSSTSMHPIRRGSITYHLNQGMPKEKVSERCDVSVKILERHYDARTEEEKRINRKEYVDNL